MGTVAKGDINFEVDDEILAKFPELVDLLLRTRSMDDDERQYWFDILPSMNDEQIDRLYEILDTERRKLAQLEENYQKEIKAINEKHLIERQNLQAEENKKKIEQAQAQARQEEGDPDDILKELDNL